MHVTSYFYKVTCPTLQICTLKEEASDLSNGLCNTNWCNCSRCIWWRNVEFFQSLQCLSLGVDAKLVYSTAIAILPML